MAIINGYCKEKDIDFNKDLAYGKLGEELANNIFEGNLTCEVKTERDIWETTGNITIEFKSRGKLSGIATTKSEIWIHWLSINGEIKGGFIFKVGELKDKIKRLQKDGNLKMVMGGDNNASQMVLLPIKELFD